MILRLANGARNRGYRTILSVMFVRIARLSSTTSIADSPVDSFARDVEFQ
jgi:hypothetical protein